MTRRLLVLSLLTAVACNQAGLVAPDGGQDSPVEPALDAAPPVDAAPPADAPDASCDHPTAYAYASMFLNGILAFAIAPDGELCPLATHPLPGAQLFALALAPAGPYLYTVDFQRAELAGFHVEHDGSLTPVPGPVAPTGPSPVHVAVDPLGRFVYTANDGDHPSIGVYALDPATGALAEVAGSPFPVAGPPSFLAGDPSGKFLYASTAGGLRGYAIATQPSFALTEVTGSPVAPHSAISGAIEFLGGFLYNDGIGLNGFRIEADGALSPLAGSPYVTNVGSDPSARSLTLDADGTLYVIADRVAGTVSRYHVDTTSGILDLPSVQSFASGSSPYTLALDPVRHHLYIGNDASVITGYALDLAGGAPVPIPRSPFAADGLQPQLVITAIP